MDLARLKDVFAPEDLEWRLQQSGIAKNGKPWALVLTYVTNRAIMDRLDEVVGPENWKNQFDTGPNGGLLCGISIKINGEWITKWDGADNTQVEQVKGGLSGAMKRAGVQWGIGRYLYKLEAAFADVREDGAYRGEAKKADNKKEYFKWNPPPLPKWALPSVYEQAKEIMGAIDNLPHLANHWKKHGKEYAADPRSDEITAYKDVRKQELAELNEQKKAA